MSFVAAGFITDPGSLKAQGGSSQTQTSSNSTSSTTGMGVHFTSNPVEDAFVEQGYYYRLTASGGSSSANYTFSSSQLFPNWLKLNPGGSKDPSKINTGEIPNPNSVSFDAEGNLYVSTTANRNIYKVAPDGTTTIRFTLPEGSACYHAVIVGNYYYVTDVNNNKAGIVRYDLSKEQPTIDTLVTKYGHQGLVHANGYIYAINPGPQKLIRINLSTLAVEDFLTIGLAPGMDVMPNGDLLVSDYETIYRLNVQTKILTPILTNLPAEARGVVRGLDGSIYIVTQYGIYRFPSGSSNGELAHTGQFFFMNATVTPSGNVVFPSYSFGKVGVYTFASEAALVGIPTEDDRGEYNIRLQVTDGEGSDEQEFTLKVTDARPLVISSRTPAGEALNVPLNTALKMVFNKTVTKGQGMIELYDNNGSVKIDITGTDVVVDGKEVTATLPASLKANTTYFVSIPDGAFKDLDGNANINDSQSPSWVFNTVAKEKDAQTITFSAYDTVTYGGAAYVPAAQASSGLAVSYSSSDAQVADFVNGKLYVKRSGEVEITATQSGDADYKAAEAVTQKLFIAKKELTASFSEHFNADKTYDGKTGIIVGMHDIALEGVVNDDYVSIKGIVAYKDKNAGKDKTVIGSKLKLTGETDANYYLKSATITGSGTIHPKSITATMAPEAFTSKVYDGLTVALIDSQYCALSGLIGEDAVSVSAKGRFADKNVGGDKVITVSGFVLHGADRDNYAVKTQALVATGEITPAPLVIVANDRSKKEGEVNPGLTLSYEGLVANERPAELTRAAKVTTTATQQSPTGYYLIQVEGAASPNYAITYRAGKLTILPKDNSRVKAWSTGNTVTVRIFSSVSQKASLILYTEAGQPVIVQQHQLQSGINTVSVPVHTLAPAFYVLNVNADQFREAERIKIK